MRKFSSRRHPAPKKKKPVDLRASTPEPQSSDPPVHPPSPSPFKSLPPELREIIWEHTLCSRLIIPKRSGRVYSPPPPVITRVCRESRRVALRTGGPVSFDFLTKHGCTAWYDPSRDVVLLSRGAPRIMGNTLCPPLWPAITSLSITKKELLILDSQRSNIFAFGDLPLAPRVINVLYSEGRAVTWFHEYPRHSNVERWTLKTIESVLGEDSVILVDLNSEDEVKRIKKKLNRDATSRPCQRRLEYDATQFGGQSENWTSAVQVIQKHWLHFYSKGDPLCPQGLKEGADTWDETDTWVKSKLQTMPRLRPVFMIYKYKKDVVDSSPRTRGARYPKVYWDGEDWWAR